MGEYLLCSHVLGWVIHIFPPQPPLLGIRLVAVPDPGNHVGHNFVETAGFALRYVLLCHPRRLSAAFASSLLFTRFGCRTCAWRPVA